TQNLVMDKSDGVIYPNPTLTGTFNVNLPDGADAVNILDMSGRIVKQVKLSGETFIEMNLGDAPAGIYVVQIVNNQNSIYRKLIVK
ncbi:MAG TPA: T9SS type A sorting domain-containing protein, partial [Bacteroidales bacterium]